ncbi:MAG: hypothetical protein EBX95_12495 [Acidimicrobiia bacterium]|jgi:hypothetical protein|nr:hypothetical protein [Actinomycetota bacterium]NDB06521.1 hypothetical protein [Acidimicrobiia bacterium]
MTEPEIIDEVLANLQIRTVNFTNLAQTWSVHSSEFGLVLVAAGRVRARVNNTETELAAGARFLLVADNTTEFVPVSIPTTVQTVVALAAPVNETRVRSDAFPVLEQLTQTELKQRLLSLFNRYR